MKFAAAVLSALFLQAASAETRLRAGDFVSVKNSFGKNIEIFVDRLSNLCVLIFVVVVPL